MKRHTQTHDTSPSSNGTHSCATYAQGEKSCQPRAKCVGSPLCSLSLSRQAQTLFILLR